VPFVFNGTVRRNIDPLEKYSDNEIWSVLEETTLIETIAKLKDGLNTDMSNVSSVFSVGQK
jgi:ATP-binding cassette subfamily C (CFTR/MRP) protein 4